jgi:hypothetical protein
LYVERWPAAAALAAREQKIEILRSENGPKMTPFPGYLSEDKTKEEKRTGTHAP